MSGEQIKEQSFWKGFFKVFSVPFKCITILPLNAVAILFLNNWYLEPRSALRSRSYLPRQWYQKSIHFLLEVRVMKINVFLHEFDPVCTGNLSRHLNFGISRYENIFFVFVRYLNAPNNRYDFFLIIIITESPLIFLSIAFLSFLKCSLF